MPRVGRYRGISAIDGHGCDGSGYRQKALVSSKTILALYRGRDVEIKEKRRQMGNKLYPLRRNAIYLRKKQVVLMPRWCLCPTIYDMT
jgi:hypothetical protein